MLKRFFLFALVNLGILLTISLIVNIFGLDQLAQQVGGQGGLLIMCLVWGMGGALVSLLISKKMAMWTMGVQLIDPNASGYEGDIVRMVHRMAREAGISRMPDVGVYPSMEVNAFATGPTKNRSLVAVSQGLLRSMNRDEVEGVLGHEIAHVANGDMVTMTLIQGVMNAFVMFFARIVANILSNTMRSSDDDRPNPFMYYAIVMVLELVFGLLGSIVVFWFSRHREFRADRGGAKLAGRNKMVAALQRLRANVNAVETGNEALATLKISGGRKGGLASLFMTHPSLEDRIEALMKSA